MELFFRVNNKVLKIEQNNIKDNGYIEKNSERYDNLFNRLFNQEMKKFYARTKI